MAQLRQGFLKGAGFLGAAGSVGFGVKIQQEWFTLKCRQTDGSPTAGRHFEVWRGVAFLNTHRPVSPTRRGLGPRANAPRLAGNSALSTALGAWRFWDGGLTVP